LVEDEKVIAYISKTGITEMAKYDEKAVKEKYGLEPNQLPDYKGLVGDPSDNIPGVKGIGPKTAVPLLKEFKTIEGIYENIGLIPEKIAKKFRDQREIALMSKKLATIRRDVPLEVSLNDLKIQSIDRAVLTDYFNSFGFQTLIKRLES